MTDKVNIAEKLAGFAEHWRPKLVGQVDDYEVKVVKLLGDFVWHKHDDEDELFMVIKGGFRMDFRDRQVELGEGEMIIVPKGIEHKPYAESECEILLLEKRGVVNTGDAATSELTAPAPERT